ncbi:hypothetical protein M1N04_00385 [Peptococcaceae bacterium]|nr:hypothetical protein [Peptococcaceae bacterium]
MCEYISHPVLRLVRTRIGLLELRKLPSGKVRELIQKELKMLMKLMKTKQQK